MKKIVTATIFCLLISNIYAEQESNPESVAFYYKSDIPVEMFRAYDWLVLDPDAIKNPGKLGIKHTRLFAYVSIGEIEPRREHFKNTKEEWVLGRNKIWGTLIADLRNSEYHDFLLSYMELLYQGGYKNFFFDTLDSYQSVLEESEWKSYEDSLCGFLSDWKKRHPGSRIIFNRGFEVIERTKGLVAAVAAESLFAGLNLTERSYVDVPRKSREWLLEQLDKIKKMGIPVISIDYVDPADRERAGRIADKIRELGFIPWVTDIDLSTAGRGPFEVKRRRILLVHDGSVVDDVVNSDVHRYVSTPIEYLGYLPVIYDLRNGIPGGEVVDRYAGIIIWLRTQYDGDYNALYKWIIGMIDKGARILFIGDFGFPYEPAYLKRLGIEPVRNEVQELERCEVIEKEPYVGYEVMPAPLPADPLTFLVDGKPVITAKNSAGQIFHPAGITEWGGYAVMGTFIVPVLEDLVAINPFRFIREVLRLENIPVPDVTTENGRRLLFIHIDGDGFYSIAEFNPDKVSAEVIRDEILTKYKVPHSYSIVECEISEDGINSEASAKLENVARTIFALDNVEVASHSFSHPFKWRSAVEFPDNPEYRIDVKGYTFDLEREIKGSVDYINRRLLPPDKEVKAFFWTGDCILSPEALAITERIGILGINGGNTRATRSNPWLASIQPMGILRDGYYQVHAPVTNENVYTDGMTYPLYGFMRVIETFELTEKPRRLKPINIYYHNYSGSKLATLNALHMVYKYALSQETTPIYTTEYIRKVIDYRGMTIASTDKGIRIRGNGELRTLRLDKEQGYPSMRLSKGVIGYRDHNGSRYVHLDGSGDYLVVLTDNEPDVPYLVESNGIIRMASRQGPAMKLRLESHVPLEFSIRTRNGSEIKVESDSEVKITKEGGINRYTLAGGRKAVIKLELR